MSPNWRSPKPKAKSALSKAWLPRRHPLSMRPSLCKLLPPRKQLRLPHKLLPPAPQQKRLPPPAESGHTVKSPMVGTFYHASSPGAEPFVEVGSTVKVGQTLCIIEAMKILNEIEAETAGTVKQILVNNGDPVEFGQPLFVIE